MRFESFRADQSLEPNNNANEPNCIKIPDSSMLIWISRNNAKHLHEISRLGGKFFWSLKFLKYVKGATFRKRTQNKKPTDLYTKFN